MLLQQNTPLIIRRNDALRVADDFTMSPERRLKADEEAQFLSEEIQKRAQKAVYETNQTEA